MLGAAFAGAIGVALVAGMIPARRVTPNESGAGSRKRLTPESASLTVSPWFSRLF